MPLIEVDRLQKIFHTTVRREGRLGTLRSLFQPITREVEAVRDISFRIEKGESVAYLGPNGAGKSTTIKMLAGIMELSGGSITIAGLAPHKNRKRISYRIGVVFGQRSQLLFDLPVRDSFDLLRYMYGIPHERYRRNVADFATLLEIEPLLGRPVRTLSLGQRMRCEIMAALLHEPDILFLDEPTIGLDVVAKEKIRLFIEQINREKEITILLITHDLGDIERLCPRLIIIDKGQAIYDGGLQLIKDRFATERKIRLVMPDAASAETAAAGLSVRPDVTITMEQQTLQLTYDQRRTDTSELLRMLLANAKPRDLIVQDENIEALIRRIYEEGIEGIAAGGAGAVVTRGSQV